MSAKIEAQLHDSLVAAAKDAIISIDEQHNIVLFNPAAEVVFRCTASEVVGKPLDRFVPAAVRDAHRRHIDNYGAHGESTHAMGTTAGGARLLSGVRADGEVFPIEASICQVDTPNGKIFTVILRDVTARERLTRELQNSLQQQKQAEMALRESRDSLRELSSALQSIRETEKTRIARELHDELGQMLTALKLNASAIADDLRPDQTELTRRAQDMKQLIDTTMRSVRRIAADLRPVMLDNLGLAPTLEWLTQDFEKRSGITVALTMPDEDLGASGDAATAVFRIVQEALTNVARHAQATRLQVEVLRRAGNVCVNVTDNGTGFSKDHLRARSFGVLGMRERAYVLGGEFAMESAPGKGTRVTATIPAFGTVTPLYPGTGTP